MNIPNFLIEKQTFGIKQLAKFTLESQGWYVFEEHYDKDNDEYIFGIEYLATDGQYDNTTTYDLTVSFGRKDYYGTVLDHAVTFGRPVKR